MIRLSAHRSLHLDIRLSYKQMPCQVHGWLNTGSTQIGQRKRSAPAKQMSGRGGSRNPAASKRAFNPSLARYAHKISDRLAGQQQTLYPVFSVCLLFKLAWVVHLRMTGRQRYVFQRSYVLIDPLVKLSQRLKRRHIKRLWQQVIRRMMLKYP